MATPSDAEVIALDALARFTRSVRQDVTVATHDAVVEITVQIFSDISSEM
jgi:hypothetical protein